MCQMRPAGSQECLRRPVHEIRASGSVRMQIDKTCGSVRTVSVKCFRSVPAYICREDGMNLPVPDQDASFTDQSSVYNTEISNQSIHAVLPYSSALLSLSR